MAQFENEPDTCSINFEQSPLIVETTFNITKEAGDSTTVISTNPNTLDSSFLTAGQTKRFTITCSHKEREVSGGTPIGTFDDDVSITNKTLGGFNNPTISGNTLTVTAPSNIEGTYPDTSRTCTFTVTTSVATFPASSATSYRTL